MTTAGATLILPGSAIAKPPKQGAGDGRTGRGEAGLAEVRRLIRLRLIPP